MQESDIDVIIPTFNRAAILEMVLPYYINQPRVKNLIIVEDGPLSSEVESLRSYSNEKINVKVFCTGERAGASVTKRIGLEHSESKYVAYGEDDAFPEAGYYQKICSQVETGLVDIICGRIIYFKEIDEKWNKAKVGYSIDAPIFKSKNDTDDLCNSNGIVYGAATMALYLGKRDVLLSVASDKNYKGNGWREETDPQLTLWSEGYRIGVNNSATFYHLPKVLQKGGGQHTYNKITYEYWCFMNDIYFFSKHTKALKLLGYSGPALFFALNQFLSRWLKKMHSKLFTLHRNSASDAITINRDYI